jgi:hypothetical protein
MSKINNLIIDVLEDLQSGYLSFRQIAEKYEITYDDVLSIDQTYGENYGS